MLNKDKSMMARCISDDTKALFTEWKREHPHCEHPLDDDITSKISELHNSMRDEDDSFEIFRHVERTDKLWSLLISKAIKCLRYNDKREPFIENSEKKPLAYGIKELTEYYNKYKDFEHMLYGSSQYYRDHVIHVFRTWLSGIECLVKNSGRHLDFISILDKEQIVLERVEKISIWTIIALTHDLGYPLEKAKSIIDSTHSMVSTFIANPDITMDLAFRGVQNYMNDYIVRLISSKMKFYDSEKLGNNPDQKMYVARLQPKYYFKFQKSLEKTNHGIVSALIIYKLLSFFLESDYSINEDYFFNTEDRRQFYIRREILRAIASHTCTDVYHLFAESFAFLLIIVDDTQEWGRKNITELYTASGIEYEPGEIDISPPAKPRDGSFRCKISERVIVKKRRGRETVIRLLKQIRNQALTYTEIFKDGQDTIKRNFSFQREYTIIFECSRPISFNMKLAISNECASCLNGIIKYTGEEDSNIIFDRTFIDELSKTLGVKTGVIWDIYDENDNPAQETKPDEWHIGKIIISLTNEEY